MSYERGRLDREWARDLRRIDGEVRREMRRFLASLDAVDRRVGTDLKARITRKGGTAP
jgi:hypothetical protein